MADSGESGRPWFVYVIECDDGRLYTGVTNDLIARFGTHASGKGAAFTRMNKPVRLLAARVYPTRSVSLKAEALLKKQPREFKLAWIAANPVLPEVARLCDRSLDAGGDAEAGPARRPPSRR